MAKVDTLKTILVELDSLLDTRLGTIAAIDGVASKDLYLGTDYYNRKIDDWTTLTNGRVSTEAFLEKYNARNVNTLALSRPTRILDLLGQLTIELNTQKLTAPDVEKVSVGINIYPYTLSKKEQGDLKTLVYSYCDCETEITVVNIAPKDLKPSLMRDYWDSVIFYNFNEWFCLHVNELNKVLIPRNTLFSAALYIKPPEELQKEMPDELSGVSPFAIIEMSMVERLGLELLSVREFCIKPNTA